MAWTLLGQNGLVQRQAQKEIEGFKIKVGPTVEEHDNGVQVYRKRFKD